MARGVVTAAVAALAYLPCLIMMTSRAHDWSTNWLEWQPSMLLQLAVLYTVPVEALTVGSAVAALAMPLLIKRAIASTWVSRGWNSDRAILLLWLGQLVSSTGDMMQNAVIVAAFVYEAAVREQMMPRKPLAKDVPAAKEQQKSAFIPLAGGEPRGSTF